MFQAVKINFIIEIRIGQLFLLVVFGLLILYELYNKILDIKLLIFLLSFGILLSLLSLSTPYEKLNEFKFIIKYTINFPAAFYVGSRILYYLTEKDLIKLSEIAILSAGVFAYFLYFFPIDFLMHDRGALTGFQGTFWESAGLSIYVTYFFLISLILRLYSRTQKNKFSPYTYILYTLSFSVIIFANTKIVWISLILLLIIATLYKLRTYKDYMLYISNLQFLRRIKSTRILLIIFVFIGIIYIYNESLENPLISKEIIQEKLENERGKALKVSLELLEQSSYLGLYGFGFVGRYFGGIYRDYIIGLGEGGVIFNSFIDIWIAVGLLGVLFHVILLKLAFSTKHFLTVALPIFLFTVGLTGPMFITDEYYWSLGILYGFKKYILQAKI